ncbi:MAG: thiamine phosphate synthase [Akkermansia sp.]
MSSFKQVAFTAQALSARPLMEQLQRIVTVTKPDLLVLREKDISDESYQALAQQVQHFCQQQGVVFFCNGHVSQARAIRCKRIQLGMPDWESYAGHLGDFEEVWVSVHSLEEAQRAAAQGAHALIFGHVYLTDCKKGLPARGIDQLRDIVAAVNIPVYAIGGIESRHMGDLQRAGAAGACRMSYWMKI